MASTNKPAKLPYVRVKSVSSAVPLYTSRTASGRTSITSCATHPVERLLFWMYVYPLIFETFSRPPSILSISDFSRLSLNAVISPVAVIEPLMDRLPFVSRPVAPVSPFSPWGPVAPVSPLTPVAPVFPLGPREPVAPVSPFCPWGQLRPCFRSVPENQLCPCLF